jgi:hypothetical protein
MIKNIPFRFLILVGLWIIELQILTTVIEHNRNYDVFMQWAFGDISITLIGLSISLSCRIVNASFICFVCFKKFCALLKTYLFIFFMLFDVVYAIVFAGYFLKTSVSVFFVFIACFFLYFAFFVFILMKLNKDKCGLIEYLCFILNTIFVMIVVPIYALSVNYSL